MDNLLEISSSFAFVGDEDTGALSNSLDQTLIVLLIFMLIQNLNLEVALLFFVVCENQAFRSGWVRLPVEVSAGGGRWEDIPEQCSLTWEQQQSQFSNALWVELCTQLVNQICQQSLPFYPHLNW